MNRAIIELEKYDEMISEIFEAKAETEILKEYHTKAQDMIDKLKRLCMESNFIYITTEKPDIAFARYSKMLEAGITDDDMKEFMKGKKDESSI